MDNNVNNNELDLSALDGLSPEEKELALSILKEYSETGTSKKLNEMKLEDYNEVPVDILTFVDDNNYLGYAWHDAEGKTKLYPYWRKELVKIFPDNFTTSINNCILSGSRGRGKTEIATLIAAYLLHRILCLKDPVSYFHLKPTEKIVFAFMNIKLALAEEIGIAKFQNTLQSSPWFMAHGTLEGRTKKVWIPQKYNDREAIDIKIGSQSDDLIGLPVYFAFFDEISFIKNKDISEQKKKANDMIDTAIGGMKTRFVHGGKNPTLLVLASSRRSEKSFLEEHMKKKVESEKGNVYISDGSVWEVKPEGTYSKEKFNVAVGNKFLESVVIPDEEDPQIYRKKGYTKIIEVPIDFKSDFIDDIDRALCDFAGISSSSISKYISGDAVTQIVTDRIKNPFVREILEIGNDPDDEAQYYNFFDLSKVDPALRSKPLFIHLDMSVSGDKTGIAGVFIKGKKPSIDAELQSNDLFYSLAFSVSIKAPKGRQVSFEKNRNFIYWLKAKGFNIKGITSDTFQSYDTGQTLLSKGYPYSILSVDRVDTDKICKPYQYLKSTIYDKRLEIYDHELLIQEITELERNIDSGKVDHPDGGCFTGNTKVKLVDGRTLSFLELIEEYKKGKINYVYSMNLQEKRIEPKKILKAWKTKENAPLVKITLDNDEIIECTLNHKFMLRNGEYIEAQNLIPGDSLMPLYIKYSSKGGLKDYRMYYEPFEDKWHFEHRQFANEILDEKHLVHHKNCNKNHNSLDNLIWCSKHAHMKIHAEMTTGSCSSEALYKKSISIQKWHKKNKNTEQYKNRAEKTRESLLKYNLKKYGRNASLDYKNRKIVSIQFLDRKEDVYDIEVEDNHNFALDAGIFVHNSKDVSDALCGAVFNASKHAEEFAYNYGETSEQLLRINSDEYDNDAQQLTLNLEEELKKMHGVLSPGINSPSNDNSEYSIYDQIVIL